MGDKLSKKIEIEDEIMKNNVEKVQKIVKTVKKIR